MKSRPVLLFVTASIISCNHAPVSLTDLRTEMLEDPVGLTAPAPRFSWKLISDQKAVTQTSYHIIVSSSCDNLCAGNADIWDSGIVQSDRSIYVPYTGKELSSGSKYWWKVKVETTAGRSEWSSPACWSTGLMSEDKWKAEWIGNVYDCDDLEKGVMARYLRKEFKVPRNKIKDAYLHICGLGLYEAYINGHRVGTQELSPTATDYDISVMYNTHDVTDMIGAGDNCIGVILGNGRYTAERLHGKRTFGLPKLIAQLEITYTDGSTETIISDTTWRMSIDGPIRANSEYDGEIYDARREFNGWNKAGFDDLKWETARKAQAPCGKLQSQTNPNITIMETIRPVSISELTPGVYVLDMGQNMVGWLKMKVKGRWGDVIKLRFAEKIHPDGSLNITNLLTANPVDTYISSGEGIQEWEPSFTYHGFRYVEITGLRKCPSLTDFEGKVLYDYMETTGSFETSDTIINRIHRNAYWGIRGNYRSMPTDCPQRNERLGWLGDRAIGAFGESYIFNNHHLYLKWCRDIEEAQKPDGRITDLAPNYLECCMDNMTWPSAFITIPDMIYQRYGNPQAIIEHYPAMKKWMMHMKDTYLVDGIMTRDHFGDWCVPPEAPHLIHSKDPERKTPGELIGTAFYSNLSNIMARFAPIAGCQEDIALWSHEAEISKAAFNRKFFNVEGGYYGNNTVTGNILALRYGLVPQEHIEDVINNVVHITEHKYGGHLSSGIIGIQQLMRGLSDFGQTELAYKLASNTTYPSWGYTVTLGATTIWELWNGDTADPAMNSQNHVMLLGDLITWMYEYIGGIACHEGSAGFKEIKMVPHLFRELDYAKVSYESVYGTIKSHWNVSGQNFTWDITIPCNTSAIVYLPCSSAGAEQSIIDSITSLGGEFIRKETAYNIFRFGSGNYKITIPCINI